MKEYIITEEELGVIERDDFFKFFQDRQPWERRKCFTAVIRSRPYQNQREKVLDDVIHEITIAAPEMDGKKLFITVLALCRRIDKLRGEQ
jgi:hypothetical protein